jgi:hypothetical protein
MGKYRGKKAHRKQHPKIFVWSHTENDEFEYFRSYQQYLKSPLLIPKRKICWTPWSLIDKTINWKEKEIEEKNICDADGDQVWCVFDVDDFYKKEPKKFLAAIERAHRNGIKIAYTNECLEHFFYCILKNRNRG